MAVAQDQVGTIQEWLERAYNEQRLAPLELRGQAAAVASAETFVSALELLPGPSAVINSSRQIIACNSALSVLFERLSGSPSAQLLGLRLGEAISCPNALLGPDGCGTAPQCSSCVPFATALSSLYGKTRSVAQGHLLLKRDLLEAEVSALPIVVGGESFVLLSVRDITQQRKLEAEREVLAAELFQAAKLSSLGTLAAGMAHEINNPLAIIIASLASLDVRFAESSDEKRCVERTLRAARRIESIVKELLEFSARKSDDATLSDVNDSIKKSLFLLEAQLRQAHITVGQQLSTEPLVVAGNAHHLEQVFFNLIKNAHDALLDVPERQLTISTFREGRFAVAQIEDNGCGVQPELQERIFDPFFTTKEPGKGTGLGLSIVHRIVSRMHGSVRVGASATGGALFSVRLPLVGE